MIMSRRTRLSLSLALFATATAAGAQAAPDTVRTVDLASLSRRARIEVLDSRSLTADLRAFEERQRKGKGVFLGPDDLDKLRPVLFQDLFAGRNDVVLADNAPTLMMRRLATGEISRQAASPSSARSTTGGGAVVARSSTTLAADAASSQGVPFCRPEIFIDNVWISRTTGTVSLTQLDQQWGAASVVAVEIYESPWRIPDSFVVMKGGECGLVAFWTSRRGDVKK